MNFWCPTQKNPARAGWPKQLELVQINDSVSWFLCCRRSTLFNYQSNLSMCGSFLIRLLLPSKDRGWLPNSKEAYDLNLNAITLSIYSSRIPTAIFYNNNCTNPWFASIPSLQRVLTHNCVFLIFPVAIIYISSRQCFVWPHIIYMHALHNLKPST